MIISHSKNILFGEHAVVYPPNTAVIAANNLSCKVEVKRNNTSSTINLIASGTFSITKTYEIANLFAYLNSVRESFKEFKQKSDIAIMKKVIKEDDDLMKLSIAVAIDYLESKVRKLEGFGLYVLSQIPPKAGFGSSAVFSSAVIAAILSAYGEKLDKDLIFELTMEIESFQHLNPSGEGPAAAIYGGIIELKRDSNGRTINKLQITNYPAERDPDKRDKLQKLMRELMVVHSGMPAETTGELVNYVKQEVEKDSSKKELIDMIEVNTQKFLELNKKESCEETELIELINNNGELLERLGVVSDDAVRFMKMIREKGGAAKISGAGGRSKGSGALLVYHTDRELVKNLVKEFGFEFFDIEFGEGGLVCHSPT
jgi:mevalonate kinase